MTFSSLHIWKQAGLFLFRHMQLLLVSPLFFVPVLTDALHSVLIGEERKGQPLGIGVALRRTLRVALAKRCLVAEVFRLNPIELGRGNIGFPSAHHNH